MAICFGAIKVADVMFLQYWTNEKMQLPNVLQMVGFMIIQLFCVYETCVFAALRS